MSPLPQSAPLTAQTSDHARLNGTHSSSAIAPAPFVSLKADSSTHSDTQEQQDKRRSSQTRVGQVVVICTPADRELETKLEDTLAALVSLSHRRQRQRGCGCECWF